MTNLFNVHEAKTHFSRLLEKVRRGEEVVIGRGGHPVARLVPMEALGARRTPGSGKGHFRVSRQFDAPLPREVLQAIEE